MNDYCIRQDIGKAEAIRQGIKKLKDDKKNRVLHRYANDIGVFMRHDTIKTMTIVINQGDVRYISKGEHFDYNGAVELMRECQEKYSDNINKCIDLFLKKCYSVGIQRG
mgnify:CR=1 FL=1